MGLAQPLLAALVTKGYTEPTPIQAQAIPSVMEGRDLLGIAQTGTGKTAAFALPILHRLITDKRQAPRRGCRCLVLSPTRELASQIAQSFQDYGKGLNLHVAVIFGGMPHGAQIRALARGIDVLVATPGRLVDHLESGNASLQTTEILVLDEVDQMLDLGFIKPIRQIVSMMSARRQNLFFSATMPTEIGKLAGELLKNPVTVSVAPVATTVERVVQRVILIEASRKKDVLVELFADPAAVRTIVFTRTKHGADKVTKHLETSGIPAAAIHGNKSQSQRERSLADFRGGRVRALVATDIAARGIDVAGVTHVINYEMPEVPESYVHRIGRTARAGAEGIAIALVDGEEIGRLRAIEKLTRQKFEPDDRRAPRGSHSAPRPSAAPPRRDPSGVVRHHRQAEGASSGEHGRPAGAPQHRRPNPRFARAAEGGGDRKKY